MTKKVVLIVDDDQLIINLYKRLFKIHNCDLLCASTGVQARDLLKKEAFDLAVIDVKLPDVDGFELLDMIHADPKFKRTTVIMFSGFFTDQ